MSGACPCGGEITRNIHQALTLNGARKWFPEVTMAELPITFEVRHCRACGRLNKMQYQSRGNLDEQHGD